MKKQIAILTSLLLGTALLTGCSDNAGVFEAKSYTAAAEEISDINIDVRDRKIEVALSEDDRIHIEYSESDKEYYNISVSDGIMTMTAEADKKWTDFIGKNASAQVRKIFIAIPDELINSLKLSTTNEDIFLGTITVTENISICVNGGSIEFEELNVGSTLSLETKNGDINGTIIGGYDDYSIDCRIKKGETNLPERKESGEKALNVTVNNGNAEIDFSEK